MFADCQLLFEGISDAILMLDRDGYITYSNLATKTIFDYSPEELVNKHLSIIYPSIDDSVKAEYELNIAIKKSRFTIEGWKRKKDGSCLWVEMSLSRIEDHSKRFVGFGCILRDVSEKKQWETKIRRSEESFRLMVESVKDYAIFMLDTTGHIVTWNDGAHRIKGYNSSEIIGKHFSIFYTAADLKINKPERELKTAIETGKYEEEGWRVRKDGSVFWASVVITGLFNGQNKHIGFSKVTRDLTDRKSNEEALRQSEERYRLLVEQVTDYEICMLDETGRIISWNEGARKMKGYTNQEIIGQYFSIFYPEEDILNGKPAYELEVAKKEGKFEEEGWRLRKDGSRFWASVVITPVQNSENVLLGFSKVTRDLTEKREAEKALRESYQRYRTLADELKITNQELSSANQELEQFTSIVSHDLQEPIRTIKSFLQLIEIKLNQQQYDDLNTYIGKSINAANRMRELIQNLLHYSQLGKIEVVKETVNVKELFNEVTQNLKTLIEKTGAQIAIEARVETVEGDRIQLVQLIQNLVSNALKFTENKKPEIKIEGFRENGHTKFAVSDNGIGIAPTEMNKIFEIFRRLHTKKEYPGTGIGLAICKKIVDRHGGRIWPESNPGKGTTFYFTLNEEQKKGDYEKV